MQYNGRVNAVDVTSWEIDGGSEFTVVLSQELVLSSVVSHRCTGSACQGVRARVARDSGVKLLSSSFVGMTDNSNDRINENKRWAIPLSVWFRIQGAFYSIVTVGLVSFRRSSMTGADGPWCPRCAGEISSAPRRVQITTLIWRTALQ